MTKQFLDIVILTSTSLTRSMEKHFPRRTVPSDQKSNRRTCAEECQMPFKSILSSLPKRKTGKLSLDISPKVPFGGEGGGSQLRFRGLEHS